MLISMHIFHTVLNTKVISYGVDKENLIRLKSFNHKLVIISFILLNLICDFGKVL